MLRSAVRVLALAVLWLGAPATSLAQVYGPYNAEFPADGGGLLRPMPGLAADVSLPANEAWALSGWIEPSETPADARAIIAGVGAPGAGGRFLVLGHDALGVWVGGPPVLAKAQLSPGAWRFVAALQGATIALCGWNVIAARAAAQVPSSGGS